MTLTLTLTLTIYTHEGDMERKLSREGVGNLVASHSGSNLNYMEISPADGADEDLRTGAFSMMVCMHS